MKWIGEKSLRYKLSVEFWVAVGWLTENRCLLINSTWSMHEFEEGMFDTCKNYISQAHAYLAINRNEIQQEVTGMHGLFMFRA